ncbi:uncharacterized protein B0J16DRAFT_340253 [Fusarium flagelliforme]|uniref:uncharacterized protein n=1 Tax=Fusarium flagelliforme TaxID=2675880 RepID=UPI001E8E5E89|nr:uncharacterized protein B0J16DRAFT_340253 [Fusarium flagelliforme]KAH7184631.1 hypothetical protein B0J16DRAFT_340253 [Fusarium flagelliforme]
MARLTDIPNEILEHIFTYVSDINHPDIFALRVVSKRFNDIAAPLRVRNWSDDGDYGHYSTSDSIVTLDRFALELLRYPELRSRVRSLKFTWIQTPHDHDPARVGLRSANLEPLAKAAEEALPDLAATTDLCQQIRRVWDDGLAVLVLVWTTNLESLTLTIPQIPRGGDWHYYNQLVILRLAKQLALRFVTRHPRPTQALPLAKLRHLDFRYWGIGNWNAVHEINMRQLTPFLYFPSLKNLKITCVGEDYEDLDDLDASGQDSYSMRYPKRTSPIESVVLATQHITMHGLRSVLGACKSLKVFRAEFAETGDESSTRPQHSCSLLARCLIDHASSLQELDLPMYKYDTDWIHNFDQLPQCFHQKLTKLRKLSIPVSFNSIHEIHLSGYERTWITPSRLPPSIEHLKLYDSLRPILKECKLGKSAFVTELGKALGVVTSIVAKAGEKGRLSQLKYIDCAEVVRDDPTMKWVEELKQTAKDRGVQVLLGDYDPLEDVIMEDL